MGGSNWGFFLCDIKKDGPFMPLKSWSGPLCHDTLFFAFQAISFVFYLIAAVCRPCYVDPTIENVQNAPLSLSLSLSQSFPNAHTSALSSTNRSELDDPSPARPPRRAHAAAPPSRLSGCSRCRTMKEQRMCPHPLSLSSSANKLT